MGPRSVREPFATYFAPAARASQEELHRTLRQVAESPLLTQLLEAVGGVMMVLNEARQIVAANAGTLTALRLKPDELHLALGLRTGEAFGCVQVQESPNGCGTGRHCSNCGTARAIMDASLNHRVVEYECELRMQSDNDDLCHEYLVRVAPFALGDTHFLLLTMQDIADKKRRENLERTFFHDVTNTLSALCAYRSLAENSVLPEPESIREMGALIDRVVEEVRTHRALLGAENQRLSLNIEHCSTAELLALAAQSFSRHAAELGILFQVETCDEHLDTDRTILLRVLTNMLKNALEATSMGGTVTLRCYRQDHYITFAVTNPGKIQSDVMARIFTRSFSTKGEPGRGLGTYSMKLFGERYLHGRVTVTSDDTTGTEFAIRLPIRFGTNSESVTRLRVQK